ncbi:hypothetical protein SSX86_020615 [Deinandra increscens subsp. villosa]|uniref:DUF4005 domain-containing protein n=1 Tax=Deinandra increscens subsp. villosa TaxID=3103831 RepID=A0AAP0GSD9_9ASTR
MGRSATSCFKIISCGCSNESVDRDEIDLSPENKGQDKSGWSFKKKSARHQVPSSTVVTEKIPSSENKEILRTDSLYGQKMCQILLPKLLQCQLWLPNLLCEENDIKCESVPDESESETAVLVIQAAVRRFLAERQLVKEKNVVKLQAAVRGHLVRSHAVGTLRCVQAIVKMQALVRARREKVKQQTKKNILLRFSFLPFSGMQNGGIYSTPTYISIEKLLNNRLARQLLESTPKTKQINIKCDPSKSDSAWNWLERWMSVSSPETLESHTPDHDQDKVVNNTEIDVKTVIPSNNVGEATVQIEEKENLINIEKDSNVQTHEEECIPESTVIPESPSDELVSETKPKLIHEDTVSETKPKSIPEDPVSETESKPVPKNSLSETEPKHTTKQIATDRQESEERKTVFGSRKASNPAFIAAQSRFEELASSKTNSLKSPTSSDQDDEPGSGSGSGSPEDNGSSDPLKSTEFSNQHDLAGSGSPADQIRADNEVVSCADTGPSSPVKATLVTDDEPRDHLIAHGSQVVKNGGSECGTELSITSTLDSPDQFEIQNKKSEEEKVLNEEAVDDTNNNNNIAVVIPEKQVDQKLDDSDIELEPESNHQGTPASQISTTKKKTKSDKKVSGQKAKSWSTSKKSSPGRSSVDSSLRSSLEQLPKDPKPVKRRNSFGSPKTNHIDHEPLIPSYMQATESARAKAVANSSPRSSPDVHDKETYLKKRHSLPVAVNGRQGSPRIQRSMSQALQTTKGNGSQVPVKLGLKDAPEAEVIIKILDGLEVKLGPNWSKLREEMAEIKL